MRLLAIDPGPVLSAYVLYDTTERRPLWWNKLPNDRMLDGLDAVLEDDDVEDVAIEMVASYGMPVGAEVFETCVWIGRFIERLTTGPIGMPRRVFRKEVKMHLCGSMRAKDSNVRQALIDRFGPGKEKAIGKKASPGPLYGFSGDGWAALGVAITAAETPNGGTR